MGETKMAGKSGNGRKTTTNSPRKEGPERRIVEPVKEGKGYKVVAPHAERASAVEPTKKAAADRAKQIVENLGGGEVTFKDEKGRITNSNTVGRGNDPHPPKDKRH
jgi:hypothetical protein